MCVWAWACTYVCGHGHAHMCMCCVRCWLPKDGVLALTYPCLLLGVTAIRPEDLEFPNTMTDIDYDTWMLRLACLLWGPVGQG